MSRNPGPFAQYSRAPPEPQVGLEPDAPGWTFERASNHERREIEGFIAASFLRAYGARLTRFFPVLMSLRHRGMLVAACGLRRASQEPLFLEAYLDGAIEHELAAATGERIPRGAIVEIGNLAVTRAGIARRLILELTLHLEQVGLAWSTFSAVSSLRNNFVRLGIPLVALASADRDRLPPAEAALWGSYYDSRPQVAAVRVAAAHAALMRTTCAR
jgi:hypothetical protein